MTYSGERPGEESRALARMLATIDRYIRSSADTTGIRQLSGEVREALLATPRSHFVEGRDSRSAYSDSPLPIGHGQTISQPFIVALMTELLQPRAQDRVLEIGTGSGYQAAVLARLVRHVYSLEIVAPLALAARSRLAALGVDNVTVLAANGAAGYPEGDRFDKIIVTAAAVAVPAVLLEQLAPGGILVAPLGQPGLGQSLTVVSRDCRGGLSQRAVLPVNFVPFTGL